MDTVDISHFLENPKGRCLPKYVMKNFPGLYAELQNTKGATLTEKIYNYFNPDIQNNCIICGKPTKFKTLKEGYSRTCSLKCATQDPSRLEKAKATKKQKYGDENFNNREKFKTTRGDQKWGFANDKTRQTIKERYGVENVSQLDDIKSKKKHTFDSNYSTKESKQQIVDKTKATKKSRYGDENYNNREKAVETIKERYGVDNTFRLREVFIKSLDVRKKSGSFRKAADKNKQHTIERHDDVISCKDSIYTCICPHPECSQCSKRKFEISISNYHGRKNCGAEMCTILNPIGKGNKNTNIELWVKEILDQHNIKYVRCNRQILSGRELDFYLPEHRIAIECNGVYWHSDEYKSHHYHMDKYNDCLKQGIQLLTIWEDQYLHHPSIIENIILSKLGIFNKRIYARQCQIRGITKQEADGILKHHLQGIGQASIRYGLYYNDELLSVMTFSKRRTFVGGTGNEYELIRFCSQPGISIIGGASKLLNKFLHDYSNPKLVSYSSNDISIGALYEKLGFTRSKQSQSYWYIEPNTFKRIHRFNMRKDVLVKMGYDKNLSESQITKQIGLFRIDDAGQTRWELNF